MTLRSSLLTHGIAACTGIAVGAFIAPMWGQRSTVLVPPASLPSAGGEPVAANPGETDVLDGRLRQVIREELARRDAMVAASALPAAPHRVADPGESPDVVAQTARANAVLDAAITRLSWTSQDAGEFRRAISTLPAGERKSLLRKFAQAVNEQQMRLETDGPPF
jgi:hypothetical protein